MKVGIDLVQINEFKKRMINIRLETVFSSVELSQNKNPENLAGVFAAKEAFFKAIGEKKDWLDVWVDKNREGKPSLYSNLLKENQSLEVSISHSGDYATAVVLLNENTD